MSPYNPTAKNVMLDALDESATQITHVGVHTLTDPGTATDALAGEAIGGGYVRKPVVWGAAAAEVKSNTGALTFDVAAGTYGFFTFWNASSGNTNNYRGYAPFGGANNRKGFGTVDTADVTADTITSNGHGLVNDDRVMVLNVLGEALPTGLTEGTIYWVTGTPGTDTFQLSTTQDGAAVNLTAVGELYWQQVIPETFGATGQITVAIGDLDLELTGV